MDVPETLLTPDRLTLIAEFGNALAEVREVDAVLSTAARAALGGMADLSVLVVDTQGDGLKLEVGQQVPEHQQSARERIAGELDGLRRLALSEARSGRRFRWIPSVDSRTARFSTRANPRLLRLLDDLHVRSLIVMALRTGGQTIGAMALARTTSSIPFSSADLGVAQVLARRVAVAVETARLHRVIGEAERRHTRLEDALRKWSRVFDLAGWGAAVVDAADRRIEMVNPAFARMHGYANPDELTGWLFDDLLAAEGREADPWGPASEGRETTYESVHRRLDGEFLPVLVNVTPLDGAGQRGSYVITVQDLSGLKRAEERLRRAQRMEAVGRLAGGVAHEVNNMMTIILGFSDLLSRAPDFADSRRRDVDEIRKAANRAARVTRQLLAFSRQQVLQPADLSMNSVVLELLPVLRLLLPANVRVETALPPNDATVRADRAQLEQVLINLAFNARDAMPTGGTIRVGTESRVLEEDTGRRLIGIPIVGGEYALVSVTDTGHGMEPDTLSQVFEPFFTTKPVGAGTGLGLATVYGIVKQSDGYVWVESVPGQGTTFTVALPRTKAREVLATVTESVQPEPSGGGTVLVVEDEDGVRELATRILQSRGFRVLQARNAADAVGALDGASGQVDVVLTDVVLPDVGTDELAHRMHGLSPDLPILYMSAYAWDDVLQRGLIRKEAPFLQKPFTAEELMRGVGKVLR